jgi:hypothetical protein
MMSGLYGAEHAYFFGEEDEVEDGVGGGRRRRRTPPQQQLLRPQQQQRPATTTTTTTTTTTRSGERERLQRAVAGSAVLCALLLGGLAWLHGLFASAASSSSLSSASV